MEDDSSTLPTNILRCSWPCNQILPPNATEKIYNFFIDFAGSLIAWFSLNSKHSIVMSPSLIVCLLFSFLYIALYSQQQNCESCIWSWKPLCKWYDSDTISNAKTFYKNMQLTQENTFRNTTATLGSPRERVGRWLQNRTRLVTSQKRTARWFIICSCMWLEVAMIFTIILYLHFCPFSEQVFWF